MAPSDDDFLAGSDDEDDVLPVPVRRGAARCTRSTAARRSKDTNFEVTRTWENVAEGADGTITGAVEGLLESRKRKR